MMATRTVGVAGVGDLAPQQLHGWNPDELDGRPRLPQQLEGSVPNELDGAHIVELTNKRGSA